MDTDDVIVAGAGIGGISAAVSAARAGARTLLCERSPAIGGTGVHTPLACICTYRDRSGRPVNTGIHREFFPHIYVADPGAAIQTYDQQDLERRYRAAIAGERLLTVRTGAGVAAVARDGRRIAQATLADGTQVAARAWVDGTADGELAALTGAEFRLGRESDGAMQPATLTFALTGIAWERFAPPMQGPPKTWNAWGAMKGQLTAVYAQAKAAGRITCPREDVLCFPHPDGVSLLFNQTRVHGVDPTDPASVARATAEARRQVDEFVAAMRAHPALADARLSWVAERLGIREGRRIVGDHILTERDCLGEARFPDMVAACAYPIDIHDPKGGGTRMEGIPGSGYYHIPYRSLVARDLDDLLLGSRCISGTHEAHSSYRVMPSVSAIGQAAGVAAALAAQAGAGVRAITAERIRGVLSEQGAFTEG
jgi:hypothetical protein